MKTSIKVLLAIAGTALVGAGIYYGFQSKNQQRLLTFVPEVSDFVIRLEPTKLAKLLPENAGDKWFNENITYSKIGNFELLQTLTKTIITDPNKTGIGLSEDIFIFSEKTSSGISTSVLFNVTDEKVLENFVKNKSITSAKIDVYNDVHFIECGPRLTLAWSMGTGLITYNSLEGNKYAQSILKRKSKTAEGNLLIKDFISLQGSVTFYFKPGYLDDQKSNQFQVASDAIASIIPSGIGQMGIVTFDKGEIDIHAKSICADKRKLDELNILNVTNNFKKVEKYTTADNQPGLIIALSLDKKELYTKVEKSIGKAEFDKFMSQHWVSLLNEVWDGNIVVAVSASVKENNIMGFPDMKFIIGTNPDESKVKIAVDFIQKTPMDNMILSMALRNIYFSKNCAILRPTVGKITNKEGTAFQPSVQIPDAMRNQPIFFYADVNKVLNMIDESSYNLVPKDSFYSSLVLHIMMGGNFKETNMKFKSSMRKENGLILCIDLLTHFFARPNNNTELNEMRSL